MYSIDKKKVSRDFYTLGTYCIDKNRDKLFEDYKRLLYIRYILAIGC